MEELEETANVCAINKTRLSGYFCSGIALGLSRRVLAEIEIKIFEKCLDNALIKNKINEPNLSKILRSFVVKYVLNVISVMNLLLSFLLRCS